MGVGTLAIVILFVPAVALADWLRLDPPPDVDKPELDLSCWLATAANMLAGAGYGVGGSVQERAEHIYGQFLAGYNDGST